MTDTTEKTGTAGMTGTAGAPGTDPATGAMGEAVAAGVSGEAVTAGVSGEAVAVERLLEAVRQGRVAEVPGLLKPLDAAARKTVLGELKLLRTEVRGWDWSRWSEAAGIRRTLRVAGAGCHTGAAAAAAWIAGRDLMDWGSRDGSLLLTVLADRDPAWLADVTQRLAERPAVVENGYALVHDLVVLSGCPVPATDAYVTGWTRAVAGDGLLDRLRTDPQTPVLVPRFFELGETPDPLTWWNDSDNSGHWPTALAALAAEGLLDRETLLEGCVARLLRGGRPRDLRFPLSLLQLLGPTGRERSGRVAEWTGMAADAPSPVAGYAQQILAELALEGELSVRELAEMSGPVLFRTEKKLVRAQLTLLTKVLRKDPAAAAELLPVVADAFGHEDNGLQERALKLVGRHLGAVDEQVRLELAGAAARLDPGHREAAEELFGGLPDEDADGAYEEILPPVPVARPVAPPAESVAELVEDLVALSKGRTRTAEEFERALDGLVRHAHRDRAVLTEAVAAAFAGSFWLGHHQAGRRTNYFDHSTHGIDVVLAALLGAVDQSVVQAGRARRHGTTSCTHLAFGGVIDARLWEVADLITTGRLPFLLAAPTWHTGAVAPLELADRLRAYQEAGVEPAPADLAQALLRLRKADPGAREAAARGAALGSRAGERLADWLESDASLAPGVRFLTRRQETATGRWWLADRLVLRIRERRAVREEFPPAFQWLGGRLSEGLRRCVHWTDGQANWAAVLPDDRETLAAWLLPSLAGGAAWAERGVNRGLTALAEGDGPVGPAVRLALAIGLGARHAEDRLTAVDVLLVLAARGELDGPGLGAELARLVSEGEVKANRLAEACRTAAATGAYATVWSVLAGVLPGLLAVEKPVRALGEVLAVAAECAERCGAAQEIPGLDAVAARRGSSQLVVQAKRLHRALAGRG
ncbi:DUF6493 family protein [Streptomyces sp. NPDC008121]|uniref:DUF7824 domain-containing protein n=1 Tax=Streptomyces sp. NPDC008121 TaxID=3364809 RepID=UPI0036EE1E99